MEDQGIIFGSNFAKRRFELESKSFYDTEFMNNNIYAHSEECLQEIELICKKAELKYVMYKETYNNIKFYSDLGKIEIENGKLIELSGIYDSNEISEQGIEFTKDMIQMEIENVYDKDLMLYYKE